MELYAQAFEQADALDKLEAFASFYGADFYGLPRNEDKVTLERAAWNVPEELPMGDTTVVPLDAGQSLNWKFV
jgi:dihydroorotase